MSLPLAERATNSQLTQLLMWACPFLGHPPMMVVHVFLQNHQSRGTNPHKEEPFICEQPPANSLGANSTDSVGGTAWCFEETLALVKTTRNIRNHGLRFLIVSRFKKKQKTTPKAGSLAPLHSRAFGSKSKRPIAHWRCVAACPCRRLGIVPVGGFPVSSICGKNTYFQY